ncbi:DUF1990 family protein [Actinomycetospora sp. NBRC 106378]|uniref:DUF1990 family protein n=1 Tax=Actinomycetospora sp. NBRC 106378 TaxID=3032208 RepID=UPI0024A19C8B|nr:DUF1990 family protein [Actinomycetospora sp. NBRC 106378]GLZ55712.1 hypothetical protein Acsp07_53290 [Actinomycetospora sp. NBRC 106378]
MLPTHPDSLNGPVRVLRWMAGMGLMTVSYLRDRHLVVRSEEPGGDADLPAGVPADLTDARVQPQEHGVGPLFHRRFTVLVDGATTDAEGLMTVVRGDLEQLLPKEVAAVTPHGDGTPPKPGDEFVVRMPGPWDGPVRVISTDDTHLRLTTLAGHLEAGQIEFRADDTSDGLRFTIETWARPGTALVNLLFTHLRVAKEMQLFMWVRACLAATRIAGRGPSGHVYAHTRRVRSSEGRDAE